MTSYVEVFNLASARLGGPIVSSLDSPAPAVQRFNAIIDEIRRETLEEFPWRCAVAYASPSLLTTNDSWEYEFAYDLAPYNVLRIVETSADSTFGSDWEHVGDVLYSHDEGLKIKYVKDLVDPAKFSPTFTRALAARMAVELAVPITNSESRRMEEYKYYLNEVERLWTIDSQLKGKPERVEGDMELIRERL